MYLCRRFHCARSYCKYRQLLNSTVSTIAVTVVAGTKAAAIYLFEESSTFLALELKLVMDVARESRSNFT